MKTKNLPMYILAGLIVLGYFALLGILTFKEVPAGNNTLYNIAMGSLLMAFATVVGYWFGSSKGSSDKNELIHKPKDVN
jgi:hypothetical protein